VLLVPDHLDMPAPFPALVAAAEATSRPRLGTLVLNIGFYKPSAAGKMASTAQLVEGRLELSLSAGYAKNEYEAAELPFPSAGQRIDHLAHTVIELRRLLAPDTHRQQAAQLPIPPIMLAGQGDRLLRLAARHADIIGLVGIAPRMQTDGNDSGQAALAKRIAFIRAAAGDRLAMVELSLMIEAVLLTNGHEADLSIFHQFYHALRPCDTPTARRPTRNRRRNRRNPAILSRSP
jgi:probable F420-dependent oxidoreductase